MHFATNGFEADHVWRSPGYAQTLNPENGVALSKPKVTFSIEVLRNRASGKKGPEEKSVGAYFSIHLEY